MNFAIPSITPAPLSRALGHILRFSVL